MSPQYHPEYSIQGLQLVQEANQRDIAALRPEGGLGKAIKFITEALHRYEALIIHVDTGSAKSSRLMQITELRGEVYSNPQAINPRSGQRPAVYLHGEFARGGAHDAPGRTVREAGARAVEQGITLFEREIARG